MASERLSSLLWRERELLDLLLFRLETEQLLLTGGKSHRLAAAAREVEVVLDEIRDAELLRAVAVDAVGHHLRLGLNPSLREIAEASLEPWQTIWLDHHRAFTNVSCQLTELSHSNRALLSAGHQAAQETLLSMTRSRTRSKTQSGTPSRTRASDVTVGSSMPGQHDRLEPLS